MKGLMMIIRDKVRTTEGAIETVKEIKGDIVCTIKSSLTNTWYSTTDLISVCYSSTLQKYVTVP